MSIGKFDKENILVKNLDNRAYPPCFDTLVRDILQHGHDIIATWFFKRHYVSSPIH